ncbi:DUF4856 domain-containing protein [Mucilaginibacter sp. JRF]|uniref:DUF4856 domain-containing protein n=1 Tax=Mucilaginibacter sp. JRF TaxID=2780088 RepID=UPI00188194ED|nr:DUF4856 domain-containing protein [Mucilaginibacter sp. JRF]MBE9583081.1 DUF4856 domain-containing protein [Mucilaginibacter sp. JRF]
MMKNFRTIPALLIMGLISVTSCKKDDDNNNNDNVIPPYEVPTTYNFSGANYLSSTQRVKMGVELNSYLGTGNNATVTAAKANDYFNNTNAPFADATLNTSGVTLAQKTADPTVFTTYFTQQASNSLQNGVAATNGTAGFYMSGTTKRLVGPTGMEANQGVAKGMMGALYFKEAMTLLTSVPSADNNTVTNGSTAMQRAWDEAFGYLGVPANYDPEATYPNTDPNRPLLWGGYLAERGKTIEAGKVIFNAFLKGRAAIGAKDYTVVNAQITIIQEKWEQLVAAAALAYVTIPTASTSVNDLAVQFHALSEGYGFLSCFKYRPAKSKLSAENYTALQTIINTNFYTLVNEAGFAKLVQAQTILKTTYSLN